MQYIQRFGSAQDDQHTAHSLRHMQSPHLLHGVSLLQEKVLSSANLANEVNG